ncbi:branched-chain-amino-acid transaminase [Saccharococcus caldoxylosilyticus]|uniref:Branched-chain-amino-acid aminotransferase n=1 Tax=Parageobacillus caldoxylosilyticus NBRC 107762 TaxID=1220594 RepID=A0A023DAY9_9BACL|nr:branched-chain-amino-acid transaminase [Parageobacillus caldoxylosilyticus]MBB3850828.1 branched-chain amino acid aminotransferase [Parageobacillus caldoxylosilyticus]BDG36999.1 branched chain amino acid aminotransferase [Parageobacillus caldoxylosilyticus]BDG40788.1 branched chain amino acid aminotransferase [Parageobacillus caldoxylosilyticus]BDG44538.1 branched chain amino acid aminotransferase [Parageobacillus caldoxylosilyticus]GAJ38277.1 branched-chain-amino-acid aminotransferase [Par
MSEQWIFLNGEFVTKENAKISVYDHGFLYGDGVFEGIRVYSGNVFRLREHIDRLYNSAKSILLTIPYTKEEMIHYVVETIRKNQYQDAYIRLVVSRGVGDLGLDPYNCQKPQVVIIAEPLTLFPKHLYETGIEVVTVATRRNRSDVLSPKVKSLNYLNNVLVKIEAHLANVSEALILNDQGYVAEGSGDNVFIIKDNVVYTPPGYVGALEGITRQAIIEIAQDLGYVVKEEPFTRHDVYVADEVFLTGTAAEVIAVVKVDGRVIGEGVPGPHTKRLLEEFRRRVVSEGVKVYPTNVNVG